MASDNDDDKDDDDDDDNDDGNSKDAEVVKIGTGEAWQVRKPEITTWEREKLLSPWKTN